MLLLATAARAGPVTAEDLLQADANRAEWLLYGRTYSNQRFSPLTQIRPDNVARLKRVWSFEFSAEGGKPQATPLVHDGTLYFTGPYAHLFAVDARTGEQVWDYLPDYDFRVLSVLCCGPSSRGVALKDERIFLPTLDARLIALDRSDGRVVWQQEIGNPRAGVIATSPPLVVGDHVVVGISGGDFGVRGYLKSYHASTGALEWQTFTIPAPGEPGNETWPGDTWKSGGGAPWLTGTYDPTLDSLYWGTGNPAPWNADLREGDNLWTNALLALDPGTGRMKWGFQYTPNDSWDYDGAGAPALVDIIIDGKPVKAAVQANRNGFLYVLDRETGRFIYAVPTVEGVNWTTGLDPVTGRPAITEAMRPRSGGAPVEGIIPGLGGGTGWYPIAFNPDLGYVFLQANLSASDMQARPADEVHHRPGVRFEGVDATYRWPSEHIGAVKAFDVAGRRFAWQVPRKAGMVSGLLATKGGLVFAGDSSGALLAIEASSGRVLWEERIGASISAPPITYELDGTQYLAILAASGEGFFSRGPSEGALVVFALQ